MTSQQQNGQNQQQLGDTVSPETRLLEKRRQMYEMQEEYETQKKDCKQAELVFREQEKELRNKDLLIQESMIQFSVFLQENDRKKNKADEQIKQQKELHEQKKLEIARKEKQLKILQDKAKRINLKKEAIMKYERYLERVQQAYPDEFEDIGTILNRYRLLVEANKNLEQKNSNLEDKSEKLKKDIDEFEKEQRKNILTINNQIAQSNQTLEKKKQEIVELNQLSEKNKSKELSKMSELAQILMAIDNIEQKCLNRQYEVSYGKSNRGGLLPHKVEGEKDKPKDYNDFNQRHAYAKCQLIALNKYAEDFREIVEGLKQSKAQIQKESKEEII